MGTMNVAMRQAAIVLIPRPGSQGQQAHGKRGLAVGLAAVQEQWLRGRRGGLGALGRGQLAG